MNSDSTSTDPTTPENESTRRRLIARWLGSTTAHEITIAAPADVVWDVYADVEHWPEWTTSVTSVELDPPGALTRSSKATIKQPRLPRAVWTVVHLEPGREWVWENRAPGARTVARHTVTAIADGRTHVELWIDQRGVGGRPIGWAVKRMTRRYLRLEAEGLARQSEGINRG